MENKKVHFIAIGGSAMHNLAIALHLKGYEVTGSDDEIFDPAKSRLLSYGIFPDQFGWFPENITTEIGSIILGMHAKADNPELLKAKELGLKIFSYPEYLYEQSKNKLRVVIGGSHGKTTITAMILHVLHRNNVDVDYMVGAKLEGFDVMVRLTESAQIMVFEGDEYLTSALDLRPKFHIYRPDIAVVSGIAWDHMNVFPTFGNYLDQFRIFMEMIPDNGSLIFCNTDSEVRKLAETLNSDMERVPYTVPNHIVTNGSTVLKTSQGDVRLKIFGKHNLMNLEGARLVCNRLNISDVDFYSAIADFKGASNRLELIAEKPSVSAFRDFAHAPSKLKATIQAAKEQFPERKLVACFELHTYSSLNKAFLNQYADAMDAADVAIVYFSPHALELKRLPMLDAEEISAGFNRKDLKVFSDPESFSHFLKIQRWENSNLLLMSSGNFDGIKVKEFAESLLSSQ